MIEKLRIPNLEALPLAAGRFAERCGHKRLIAFSGEMGAGKTTFIQSLCQVLGVPGEVVSPTFALINEYFTQDGSSIFHFDLYRIENEEELYDIGYEEYFYSGASCFIEWPEKAAHLIPDEALMVHISVLYDGSRELSFDISGE